MKKRISGKLSHFDVKNAFGSKKNKINEFLVKKNVNLKSYSKIILLASHSLSDANHSHFEIGSRSPFKDYFSQIKETLDLIKSYFDNLDLLININELSKLNEIIKLPKLYNKEISILPWLYD